MAGRLDPHRPGLEDIDEVLSRRCLAVEHEHAQTLQRGRQPVQSAFLAGNAFQGDGEPECRSAAGLALHADPAAHRRDEGLADRQPQAGAAVPSGYGRVGLAEGLEQAFYPVWRNADTRVADAKDEKRRIVRCQGRLDADGHLAGRGEFDGVSNEVHQELTQASAVAAHRTAGLRGDMAEDLDLFLTGLEGHGLHGLFHEPAQIEVVFVQLQLAGFDLGEVEDVVDQGQERLAAVAAGFRKAPLPLVELGVAEQFRHADDTIEGRTQLVAHRGQKLALGRTGLLGLLLGQAEAAIHAGKHHGRHGQSDRGQKHCQQPGPIGFQGCCQRDRNRLPKRADLQFLEAFPHGAIIGGVRPAGDFGLLRGRGIRGHVPQRFGDLLRQGQ